MTHVSECVCVCVCVCVCFLQEVLHTGIRYLISCIVMHYKHLGSSPCHACGLVCPCSPQLCPLCAALGGYDTNTMTDNLVGHMATEHTGPRQHGDHVS